MLEWWMFSMTKNGLLGFSGCEMIGVEGSGQLFQEVARSFPLN